MKKQKKILVVAAIALMIALVSGMGAMTYARYITSAKLETQQATAAKWGYVVNITANNLFAKDYVKNGDYSLPTTEGDGVAIKASNKSLAPGASGSLTVSISGSAEVLAKLTLALNVTKNIHLDDYYPIKWSLATQSGENAPVPVAGATGLSLGDFNTKLATISRTLEVGDPLDVKYVVSWAWDFNAGNSDAAIEASMKDTLIGYKSFGAPYANLANAIAPNSNTYQSLISQENYDDEAYLSYTLELTFSATVEQIQAE